MDYPLMEPPFEVGSHESLSKKKAQILFDWFINEIPQRISVLEEFTNGEVDFNYTPESLIDVYSWYLSQIEIYELSEEEIGIKLERLSHYPDFIYQDEKERLLANPVEIGKVDYAIAMDIGIYYGETVRKNYPQVKWTYFTKPKSHPFLNKPLLYFNDADDDMISYEREPIDMMFVLNQRIKRGEITDHSLYELYQYDVNEILGIFEDPED